MQPIRDVSHRSLTRKTLVGIGVRILCVILLTTAATYYCFIGVLRKQTCEQLGKYVAERAQRERMTFTLTRDNQAVLKEELVARLKQPPQGDETQRFHRLFALDPDGVIRNRPLGFNGRTQPNVYLGLQAHCDAVTKHNVLAFYDLCRLYGRAFHTRFQDTYITTPENIIVLYWPECPGWARQARADLRMPEEEYGYVADARHDPSRRVAWTGVYFDKVSERWMISGETPVDIGGRHVATIGQDIMLDMLLDRTLSSHLVGTYNVLFRADGRLLAKPGFLPSIEQANGGGDIRSGRDPQLRRVFDLIRARKPKIAVLDNVVDGQYLAVARIDELDSYFVTVFPKSLLAERALTAARYVLILGFITLVLTLGALIRASRRMEAAVAERDARIEAQFAELQAVEKRYQRIVLNVPGVVYQSVTHPHGVTEFPFMSGGCRELFQVEPEAVYADPSLIFAMIHPEDRESFDTLAASSAKLLTHWRWEGRMVLADGSVKWVQCASKPERAPTGATLWDGIVIDVTERRQAQSELLQAERQLIQSARFASLGTLSTGVAHELNQPIAIIRGITQQMAAQADLSEENREDLTLIEGQTGRMIKIITHMRSYCRGDNGLTERVEPNRVLSDCFLLIGEQIRSQNISIVMDLDARNPSIAANANELEQVCLNLVTNARDALQGQPGATITVRTHLDAGTVTLTVRDNGPGIPEGIREQIFDPFFTTKEPGKGSGLGLSFCQNIVVRHGGTMECHNDEGAVFTMRFPMAAEEAEAPRRAA